MSIKNKIKKRLRKKTPGFYLLLSTLARVVHRDERYINGVLLFQDDHDYEYLDIKHNGNTDYGKIIYVIKENTGIDGFCATLTFVACDLIFATQNGLAPVVRLTKEFAYFDAEKSKETANPWDYYFVTKNNYDENTAMNVSYCNYFQTDLMRRRYNLDPYKVENYYNESIFEVCSPIVREYFTLRPEIVNASADILKEVTEKGGKILGVHFRGTDYKQGYNNHPVYVDEKQTIEEIQKAMDTGEFEAIFLATDDALICERIKKAFSDTLIIMFKDVFRSEGDESVAFSTNEREYHRYNLGLEVARDMYTLSLCDGLIAGKSSVSFWSNLYKHSRDEEYEYLHIIDNGNYSNNNEYFKES